jgi:hypothetical protein
MRKLLILAGLAFCQLPMANATDYYVDSTSTGTNFGSKANPWKSLAWNAPINQTAFQAGDRIFFRKGRTYVGQLMPIGSGGSSTAPVLFDSYEEPGDPQTKPVIAGMGASLIGSTIYLKDKSYVTVQNLEVTNWPAGSTPTDGKAGVRDGIRIQIYGAGVKSGIKILNNTIRQIRGITARSGLYGNAAIYVITSDSSTNARWDDVLIEGNDISDSTCIGLYVKSPPYYSMTNPAGWATNMVIRGNTFQNMGADHIVLNGCESPLVEFNKGYGAGVYGTKGYEMIAGMWTCFKTQNTLFQYNEVAYTENEFENGASGDSKAFDVDYGTQGNHVFQYNYTHHNDGGVLIIMPKQNGTTVDYPKTTVYRYNLSVNDGRNTGDCSQFGIHPVMGISSAHIHNNVFYSTLPEGYRFTGATAAYYSNNVFHFPRGIYPSHSWFSNNAYFGHEADVNDPYKVVADPKFVSPFPTGAGGDGDIAASTDIFKLQSTSPLINAGKAISITGVTPAQNGDYWANPLNQGLPDIGAHEHTSGASLPAAPTAAATTVYEDNNYTPVDYSHDGHDPLYWTFTQTPDGALSGGTQHVSYQPGKWVEVTFTGSNLSLYGRKGAAGGHMSVTVDGVVRSDVADFYSPVDMWRTEVYRVTGLNPNVQHTVRFTVLSTKNPFSSNKYCYIDYFEKLPVTPAPLPKVTVIDDSAATVAGTWSQETNEFKFSYGKTRSTSSAQNSYLEFTFTGTGVRLYGVRAADRGLMTVTLNGVNPVQINTFSPVTALDYIEHRAKLFEKRGLPYGTYILRARVDSNDGKKISLDYVEGLVESHVNVDTNGSTSSLVYTGSWTHSADATYFNGTKSVASANNASVEFTFTGNAVKLFGKKAPNLNKLNISVNNGAPVLVDCTSTTTQVPVELFSVTGLVPGVNKIKATIYDPANSGKTVGIDYFQYQP